MAYSVNCNFNRIQSYNQALTAWNDGVIFRNEPAVRGLVNKRKKHMTVGLTEVGDIVLRLYGHDTVTWHPDNSVTIRSYLSQSTVTFVNRCTPLTMRASIYGGSFSISTIGRTYKVSGWITFRQYGDNTWKPDQITPWQVPVVNRERAKQALKDITYKDFRLWLKTYVQMTSAPTDPYGFATNVAIINMLRDRRWRDLAQHLPRTWQSLDQVLSKVRQAIYQEYDCIDYKDVPFLGKGSDQ